MMEPNPHLHEIKAELIDISPVMVVLLDCNQNIIWANKTFKLASKLTSPDFIGKKCFNIWGLSRPCMGCPVAKTLIHGDDQEALVSIGGHTLSPYGQESWLVKSSPIR